MSETPHTATHRNHRSAHQPPYDEHDDGHPPGSVTHAFAGSPNAGDGGPSTRGLHTGHSGHSDHAGHAGHDKHAGHDPEAFRRKFWLSLALTVPVVATSHMVMDWFGYRLDFPGMSWVGPALGTFVFFYGGWPFLAGAVSEVRDRAPGMMLLIAMAISVAYTASLATSVGWFNLEFWWELAALVTIMLLGHWQEMKAIGQASGALAALAALLPDDAERLDAEGIPHPVSVAELVVGDVVLIRAGGGRGGGGRAPRRPTGGSWRAPPSSTSRW
jgi:Cu2+-exporting ATPase